MHELGICDALLKMVGDVAREEQLDGVKKVTVEVGTLSGVVPAFLTDCWEAVTDGTAFDGVELAVVSVPGEARCLDCGTVFTADLERLVCPGCGGTKLTPISGRGLTLAEIEEGHL